MNCFGAEKASMSASPLVKFLLRYMHQWTVNISKQHYIQETGKKPKSLQRHTLYCVAENEGGEGCDATERKKGNQREDGLLI